MGMKVHQGKLHETGKVVWTREELEAVPTEKYFWVLSLEGKSSEEKRKAAKSIRAPLATVHRWMKLARYGGPEALLPQKKQRRMYQAVKPATAEEAELVAQLLAVLRDPAVPKDSLKQHLRESYELMGRLKDKITLRSSSAA